MSQERFLGLDYGRVRIGVAVSDELALLAHPREAILAEPRPRALRAVRALVSAEGIRCIVIGLPRNMDGSAGRSEQRVRQFADALGPLVDCPIEFVDERLSTVQASLMLREGGVNARSQKQKIDSAAAAILLQTFLDGRRS